MEPLVKHFALITKFYLGVLDEKLKHLPLVRYHYIITLIGENHGNTTLTDLAKILHVDKVTITRAIQYLTKNGFTRKIMNARDRRSVNITLTAKGLENYHKIRNAFRETDEICYESLNTRQQDKLVLTLKNISNQLENSPRRIIKSNIKRSGNL
jgi:DNA-binding MarR family transcriptional regulator